MKVIEAKLKGLKIVELDVHGDSRGFFIERYNKKLFEEHNLPTEFYQDNHSRSAPSVIRGMHYQYNPTQGKLVGVLNGTILDVVVDIRPESETYGHSYSIELSDMNGKLLWVPGGFAHGFCVLGDNPADVLYKVTAPYTPEFEGGIMWNDPEFGIEWPISNPIISNRDQNQISFADYKEAPPEWK